MLGWKRGKEEDVAFLVIPLTSPVPAELPGNQSGTREDRAGDNIQTPDPWGIPPAFLASIGGFTERGEERGGEARGKRERERTKQIIYPGPLPSLDHYAKTWNNTDAHTHTEARALISSLRPGCELQVVQTDV